MIHSIGKRAGQSVPATQAVLRTHYGLTVPRQVIRDIFSRPVETPLHGTTTSAGVKPWPLGPSNPLEEPTVGPVPEFERDRKPTPPAPEMATRGGHWRREKPVVDPENDDMGAVNADRRWFRKWSQADLEKDDTGPFPTW